jgi:hypothetical protein
LHVEDIRTTIDETIATVSKLVQVTFLQKMKALPLISRVEASMAKGNEKISFKVSIPPDETSQKPKKWTVNIYMRDILPESEMYDELESGQFLIHPQSYRPAEGVLRTRKAMETKEANRQIALKKYDEERRASALAELAIANDVATITKKKARAAYKKTHAYRLEKANKIEERRVRDRITKQIAGPYIEDQCQVTASAAEESEEDNSNLEKDSDAESAGGTGGLIRDTNSAFKNLAVGVTNSKSATKPRQYNFDDESKNTKSAHKSLLDNMEVDEEEESDDSSSGIIAGSEDVSFAFKSAKPRKPTTSASGPRKQLFEDEEEATNHNNAELACDKSEDGSAIATGAKKPSSTGSGPSARKRKVYDPSSYVEQYSGTVQELVKGNKASVEEVAKHPERYKNTPEYMEYVLATNRKADGDLMTFFVDWIYTTTNLQLRLERLVVDYVLRKRQLLNCAEGMCLEVTKTAWTLVFCEVKKKVSFLPLFREIATFDRFSR